MTTVNINGKEINVEQFNDWALALMNKGIIVRLNVHRWRGTTSLTSEALGLKFSDDKGLDFMNKYIELGRQKLLPPDIANALLKVEVKGRKCLDTYSFDTVWGKFIPFTAFEQWEKENKEIEKEYLALALDLGTRYDFVISVVKEEYKKMAKDVWLRLYPQDQGGATPAFIENFVDNVIKKIPSREEIIASFAYNVTYFVIPMPAFVQENIAKAESLKVQTEMEKFNAETERQMKVRVSEEYLRRKSELIESFLQSTVTNMRKYIGEFCEGILKSITRVRKINRVTMGNINKVKEMVRKVRYLNFYDDAEITKLLSELETEIDKVKGETDRDVIIDKLQKLVDIGNIEFITGLNSIKVLEL